MATPPTDTDPMRRLLKVMATLRAPGGCPWDREQDHRSLIPFLIEEAYELVEAIESGDNGHMGEELGDVLLQVVFHAQIASERGNFDFDRIATGLADKLVARHPHVFGGAELDTAEDVRRSWDAAKAAHRDSRMDGIPAALPALQRAQKAGSRAAAAGFDWRTRGNIVAKIREEIEEFAEELEARSGNGREPEGIKAETTDPQAMELEFGDMMFALVQLARWEGIDAESALRKATDKFMRRFRIMEREMHELNEKPEALSDEAWWTLWAQAKDSTP